MAISPTTRLTHWPVPGDTRTAPRRRLAPALALLIALNLSLLTPITYMVDYLLWQRPDAAASGGASCDIHQILPLINSATGGMATIHAPQAAYELLSLPTTLLILTSIAIAPVELCSCTAPRRPAGAPPTPPPRFAD